MTREGGHNSVWNDETWTSRGGQVVPLDEMEASLLGVPVPNGEMAAYDVERMIDEESQMDPVEWLESTPLMKRLREIVADHSATLVSGSPEDAL